MTDDDEAWPVYWRLFHRKGGRPGVVCLQEFDERDYDPSRFVTDVRYGSEAEALRALDAEIGRAWRLLHEGSES